MTELLVWATLLGGAAAIIFFWDKFIAWIGRKLDRAAPPKTGVKYVDLEYPTRCGLQQDLEAQGYRVRWSREDKLPRRVSDGWDPVVEVSEDGTELMLKVRDSDGELTLVMRKG